MDFLIELLLELVIEGGTEVMGNKRMPKSVRYILATLLASLYVAVSAALIIVGVLVWDDSTLGSALIIVFGVLLAVAMIIKLKKAIITHQQASSRYEHNLR